MNDDDDDGDADVDDVNDKNNKCVLPIERYLHKVAVFQIGLHVVKYCNLSLTEK